MDLYIYIYIYIYIYHISYIIYIYVDNVHIYVHNHKTYGHLPHSGCMVDRFFYCIIDQNQYYGRSLVILCLPKREKLSDIKCFGNRLFP